MNRTMPEWLKDAVFYEIYPQSYQDSNGDGIGDIPGMTSRLPYIKSLGCNAIWLNPLFDSPFKDAGYDVRDYKKVAPRYGTNEDLYHFFDEAHKLGMHVFLDLVPGHTSEEHPWFLESGKAARNEYSDRYIWTDFWLYGIPNHPYIGGECERNGVYMLNFFKCQPALNYGFAKIDYPWQQRPEDPGPMATREAIKDVCRFWLGHGCDGFRVDMADSLVKEDEGKKKTGEVWQDILGSLRKEFPQAAFVSEWSNPAQSLLGASFDMDFYLDHPGNGYNTLVRDYETKGGDHSYFAKDRGGDIERFLADYLPKYEKTAGEGYISFLTGNHDTPRISFHLDSRETALAYALFATLPGVPFLYYGDEIGMRYQAELPTKEGGYTRTGSRTPMQWSAGKNAGFSDGDEKDLYLPVDADYEKVNVAAEEADPGSLLHTVRDLLALRHGEKELQADGSFAVVYEKKEDPLFVYRRGGILLALNPSGEEKTLPAGTDGTPLYTIGTLTKQDGNLVLGPQSCAALRS